MSAGMRASARAVQQALDTAGLELRVVELPDSTRTALEAAAAVGCDLGQIAKSIVFQAAHSEEPVLVIASGKNRIREAAIAERLGEPVRQAKPEFVRAVTGFAIGGVPPCGHARAITTFLDQDLFDFAEIWAAAGTPHALFKLTPAELRQLTGAPVIQVT
jgi:prolyl-tRNA editing enzyme YbaK/EbsC (Cys-tRNA(Pro) deacylase)